MDLIPGLGISTVAGMAKKKKGNKVLFLKFRNRWCTQCSRTMPHAVLLPDQNTAPSPHLGAAVTPVLHSKAHRKESISHHSPRARFPPAKPRTGAPAQKQQGKSSNPGPFLRTCDLSISSFFVSEDLCIPASQGCEGKKGDGPVTGLAHWPIVAGGALPQLEGPTIHLPLSA